MARSRGRWLGIVLIVLGILFLLDSTDWLDIGSVIRTYWPLLLVLWGIGMLVRPHRHDGRARRAGETQRAGESKRAWSDDPPSTPGENFENANVFGDVDIRVASSGFRGGSASTVFGDVTVDCRQGGVADGEQVLTVSGVFGDAHVIVPPGVAIDVTAHTLAGDLSVFDRKESGISPSIRYTSPGYETAPKRLKLRVSQVFGDIDVSA